MKFFSICRYSFGFFVSRVNSLLRAADDCADGCERAAVVTDNRRGIFPCDAFFLQLLVFWR